MAVVFIASPESLPHGFVHAQARYDSVFEEISRLAPDEDILLVVRDAVGERIARGVRMALSNRRIGIYATDAPVTLFFMYAAVLDLLPADHLGMAELVATQVAANSQCQVLVSSVAKISRPNPKLLDHALSALPWSRFRVDWTNQQITREKQLRTLQAPLLIAAKSQAQWKDDKLDPLPNDVVMLPSQPDSHWEAKRWIELSVFFLYPEALAQGIVDAGAREGAPRCVSCTRLGGGERCLFCEVPVKGNSHDVITNPQPEFAGGNL